jgi:hypothetical protein
VESVVPSQYSSHYSKGSKFDGKLRDLESIYLQRLEATFSKGAAGVGMTHGGGFGGSTAKKKITKPRFRKLQDRFINDPEFYKDEFAVNDDLSSLFGSGGKRKRQISGHTQRSQQFKMKKDDSKTKIRNNYYSASPNKEQINTDEYLNLDPSVFDHEPTNQKKEEAIEKRIEDDDLFA